MAGNSKCLRIHNTAERRKMATTRCFSYFSLFIALLSAATVTAHISNCAYTIMVKTADQPRAGTDSKIKLTIGDYRGQYIHITDLEKWGLMGKDYDYYERGNLDIFGGRDKCLRPPICRLKIESDAKGESPGWLIEYFEVTYVRPESGCKQVKFPVNKWLGAQGVKELTVLLEECMDYVA